MEGNYTLGFNRERENLALELPSPLNHMLNLQIIFYIFFTCKLYATI